MIVVAGMCAMHYCVPTPAADKPKIKRIGGQERYGKRESEAAPE